MLLRCDGDTVTTLSSSAPQLTDQSIKNLEDQQDEYDFKINTLKIRGEARRSDAPGVHARAGGKTASVFLQRTKRTA